MPRFLDDRGAALEPFLVDFFWLLLAVSGSCTSAGASAGGTLSCAPEGVAEGKSGSADVAGHVGKSRDYFMCHAQKDQASAADGLALPLQSSGVWL